MWKKEWDIRIDYIGYLFSNMVPDSEIRAWKKELKKEYRGEMMPDMPESKEGAIVITDSIVRCKEAAQKGIPYLLYLHDGNRQKDFGNIPYAVMGLQGIDYTYMLNICRRFFHIPWTIMETKRCILREITEDDLDELYEIYADPSVTKYTEGLYEDKEAERAYLKDYTEKVYRFYGYGVWAVIHKESGKMIGRAGLSGREGFDTPELGYVIAVPFQRQGYATEVCRAILDYAVCELGFEQIRVLFRPENVASCGLARRLGFRQAGQQEIDGTIMQQYIYTGMVKGENKQ